LALLDQLGMIEPASLGTAEARQYRAAATPAHVARILQRQHELSWGP
jgi:hypothetical protein